ncbi:MAG: hypothetical protein GXO64_03400 [Candidatus Micrarchaeota archaeon]|nr:hypothetical protein [Candidatus Micrarchaeota archaeon]
MMENTEQTKHAPNHKGILDFLLTQSHYGLREGTLYLNDEVVGAFNEDGKFRLNDDHLSQELMRKFVAYRGGIL